MADKKIGEATHDDNIGGSEKIPMDDAGTAKYATTGDLKGYVIDQIEALTSAESVATATDKVYLLKDGVLKPVSAETLAAAVLDYGFGKAAVSSVSDTDKIGVKSGSNQKTVTVDALKNYMATSVAIPWASITEASSASDLANDDYLVFRDTSASGDKKVKFVTYKEYVCAAFKAYVEGLAGITGTDAVQNNDLVYLVHNSQSDGTVARKATIAQLIAAVGSGDVIAPSFTSGNWGTDVAGKIPKWDTTQKTLTKGYAVQTSIRPATGGEGVQADSNSIPTEAAVRGALDTKVNAVDGMGLSKNDYSDTEKLKVANAASAVSPWSSGKTYSAGQYCTYNSRLYCRKTQGSDGTFNPSSWDEVPVYPSTSDTTKFLRADKTWVVPPTATVFTGATSGETPAAGTSGLVPAPTTGDINKFLRGNGNWDDPTTPCAIAPATVTANKIPQWSGTGKELTDGLSVATSNDTSNELSDTTIPTVSKTFDMMQEALGTAVFANGEPTVGKIPKWSSSEQLPGLNLIEDGYSSVTAVGNLPSDDNLPTEKAVSNFVSAKVPYAKIAGVFTGNLATLANRTVQRFSITTGTNYTMTLPSAVSGLSRDFYVVFSQAPAPSGSTATFSEITFANPSGETVEIHGKNGVFSNNKISLTWDATGSSNAYHVYHFFEDNAQLWCVNEFDSAENTGTGGAGYVKHAVETISGTVEKSLVNRNVYAYSFSEDGVQCTLAFPNLEESNPIDIYVRFCNTDSTNVHAVYVIFSTPVGVSVQEIQGGNIGIVNNISVPIDNGKGKVFHFFEVGGQILYENVGEGDGCGSEYCLFDAYEVESGVTTIEPYPNESTRITFAQGSNYSIEPDTTADVFTGDGIYESYIIGTNPNDVAPTITTAIPVMLPSGVSSIGDLFAANKVTMVKCSIDMEYDETASEGAGAWVCKCIMLRPECERAYQAPSAS